MKIKKSQVHPNSLHNYLANSTVVKRERYYLRSGFVNSTILRVLDNG